MRFRVPYSDYGWSRDADETSEPSVGYGANNMEILGVHGHQVYRVLCPSGTDQSGIRTTRN
jgi:hypothetical protein